MTVSFDMDVRNLLTSKILAFWYANTTMRERERQTNNDKRTMGEIRRQQGGEFLYVANILAANDMLDEFLASLE